MAAVEARTLESAEQTVAAGEATGELESCSGSPVRFA
jgi:hypothetical protein